MEHAQFNAIVSILMKPLIFGFLLMSVGLLVRSRKIAAIGLAMSAAMYASMLAIMLFL